MNEQKIETAAALGNALVDRVDDFLHHFTSYATDLEVGIHPETFDIILDSPNKIPESNLRPSICCTATNRSSSTGSARCSRRAS